MRVPGVPEAMKCRRVARLYVCQMLRRVWSVTPGAVFGTAVYRYMMGVCICIAPDPWHIVCVRYTQRHHRRGIFSESTVFELLLPPSRIKDEALERNKRGTTTSCRKIMGF